MSGRKRCTTNRENRSLWGLSRKIDSRVWVNFTRNGLRLGSRHQEHHTQTCRGIIQLSSETSYLAKRRRTGLLPGGPKSFSDESKFCISFGNQGPRVWRKVEKLIAQVAWSPVLSFHSLWWFGAMSSAGVGPLCFLKTNITAPVYQECWSTSCFLLLTSFLKKLISFSSRIWLLPTLPKAPKVVKWPCFGVLDWPANSPDLNIENMRYCQEENEKQDQKMQMSWRPLSKNCFYFFSFPK